MPINATPGSIRLRLANALGLAAAKNAAIPSGIVSVKKRSNGLPCYVRLIKNQIAQRRTPAALIIFAAVADEDIERE